MRQPFLWHATLTIAIASADTTFIAGASRGLGLELARAFATAGGTVHATMRSAMSAPGALGAIDGVKLHSLDVANATQVSSLASEWAASGAIDMLLHNAGINNGTLERQMEVNGVAPFRLVEALMPALLRSQHKRVCIITSDRGTRYYVRRFQERFSGRRGGRLCKDVPYCAYATSKGAAHDTFRRLEPKWRAQGVTAVAIHPGGLSTDMNGGLAKCLASKQKASGRRKGKPVVCTSAADRAPDIQRLCAGLTPKDAGKLLNWKGEHMEW